MQYVASDELKRYVSMLTRDYYKKNIIITLFLPAFIALAILGILVKSWLAPSHSGSDFSYYAQRYIAFLLAGMLAPWIHFEWNKVRFRKRVVKKIEFSDYEFNIESIEYDSLFNKNKIRKTTMAYIYMRVNKSVTQEVFEFKDQAFFPPPDRKESFYVLSDFYKEDYYILLPEFFPNGQRLVDFLESKVERV